MKIGYIFLNLKANFFEMWFNIETTEFFQNQCNCKF